MRKCKHCGHDIAGKYEVGKSGYEYFHVKKGSLGIWMWTKHCKECKCTNPEPKR